MKNNVTYFSPIVKDLECDIFTVELNSSQVDFLTVN